MKAIITFTILLFICDFVYSQEISDIPPYKTVPLNWTHYSDDPNFPEIADPRFTKYGLRWWNKSIEREDFIYILENTHTAIPGYFELDGFLLFKIDKFSGKRIWYHEHNQHVGQKYFEISTPYIDFNEEGNINILSYRDRDTMPFDNKYWRDFVFTPAVHTIDHLTGQKLDYQYGKDTTKFINTRLFSGSRMHMQEPGKYLSLNYISRNENGLTKDFLEIHDINDSLNIERNPFYTFKIDTDLVTQADLGYKPWIEHLYNGDTMVILTGTSKPIHDIGNSPDRAFLRWFDIRDKNNFHQTNVIEVTDAFARPQNNVFEYPPTLHFRDNNVFLTQVMQPNSFVPSKTFSWMCWYDAQGELLGKFQYVTWLDTFYLKIIPIGVKNGNAYLLAQYYKSGIDSMETMDILEVKPHTNFAKKVGQFISYNHLNGNFRSYIWDAKFLDNGTVLIENQFSVKKGDKRYYYNFTCNVNEEDLGINPTSTVSEINNTWSYIYPNPTSDYVFIQADQISSYNVEIRDITGALMMKHTCSDLQNIEIDVSHLPSAMYHVNIKDTMGRLPAMNHKMVKL